MAEQSAHVKITKLEASTLAGTSTEIAGLDEIPRLAGSMFEDVARKIHAAGGEPGVGVTLYDQDADHPKKHVTFTVGYLFDEGPVEGLQFIDLPATDAAVTVYRGSMKGIGQAWQQLESWLDEQEDWTASGPSREVYATAGKDVPQEQWVTHLQQPVKPAVVAEGEHLRDDEEMDLSGEDTSDDGPSGGTDEAASEGGEASGEDTSAGRKTSEADETGTEEGGEAPKTAEPSA